MPRHPLTFHVAAIGFLVLSPVVAVADSASLGQENFRQADADNDGQLVYAEFATFIDLNAADGLGNAARVSSRGLHARAFERVDANGDGIVKPEELRAMR
jgi:Ca2+-binding EF-hand superfamily protein